MKGVALLVVWGGFVFVAWGANRLNNGCVSWAQVAWPQGGPVADPCAGVGTTAASQAAAQAQAQYVGSGGSNYQQFLAQRVPNPKAA